MGQKTRIDQLRDNAEACETHEDMADAYISLSDALESRVADLERFVRFVSRNKGSHTAMATELMQRLGIDEDG